jgi:hypothetical protein
VRVGVPVATTVVPVLLSTRKIRLFAVFVKPSALAKWPSVNAAPPLHPRLVCLNLNL